MSDQTVETRLRELAEKATPGPWRVTPRGGMGYDIDPPSAGARGMFESETDAAYVAALDPQTVLRLLDLVAAARKFNYVEDEVPNQDEMGGCVFCGGPDDDAYAYATRRGHHAQDCEWLVLHDRFAIFDAEKEQNR